MVTAANAAPNVQDRGIHDGSIVQVARAPRPLPQHLPKYYLFCQKGRAEEELLVGVERDNVYGTATFTDGSPYFNHGTIFANGTNAQGNAGMYKRLIPADAGPKSNITLWLDVLETRVDLYERLPDGSIKTNTLGDPIVVGTTPGYKVKWVATSASTHQAAASFGIQTQTVGDQFDPTTMKQSIRYPIFDFVVDSQGEYGNNLGIRMWSPRAELNQVPFKMMNQNKAFPYLFSIIERESNLTSPVNKPTLFGEQSITVTLKPNSIDPITLQNLYIENRVVPMYGNTTDPRYAIQYPPFGQFHIYQKNVDLVLAQFFAAEVPFIDEHSDFTADPEDAGLFNIITGVTTTGVPYHSFIFVNSPESITFSQFTDVLAAGGSDGTMTNEVYNAMVAQEIRRYRNRDDSVMQVAYHVESIFYDSGFDVDTKMELTSFISQRHDTFLVLGTHQWGERKLTLSEEHSLAVALRARVQNYPESDYYGTPTVRCMIMGCSGVIRNTVYRVPATYEVAIKFARYMGASNGRWNGAFSPEGDPGSIVGELTDINETFVNESLRTRFWDVGLNWIGRFDREQYYIPAYKTVYPYDTSVLTSVLTTFACCTLNKIGHACHRTFVGRSDLTDLQLTERVDDYVRNAVKDKFDGRFIIIPEANITALDEQQGFSWTLPIKIGANGMKTVQTLSVQADRRKRLEVEQ